MAGGRIAGITIGFNPFVVSGIILVVFFALNYNVFVKVISKATIIIKSRKRAQQYRT